MKLWLASFGLLACGTTSTTAMPDGSALPAAAGDGSVVPEASTDASTDGQSASRCVVDVSSVTCTSQALDLSDSVGLRTVTYQTPLGPAPSAGWPAVLYFQGSFLPGHTAFGATTTSPFGMFELTLTIKALLDGGYAVISPDASNDGNLYWETNIPPYATSWAGCPDDVLMQNILAGIGKGSFGSIDTTHLYAMGISSGGFMTSRMAVSYAGKFRALADASGSYATCGPTCSVPATMPAGHPPTLFLHGDQDTIVPMSAVQPYLDALNNQGFETKLVTDSSAGHQWLTAGKTVIPAWFSSH